MAKERKIDLREDVEGRPFKGEDLLLGAWTMDPAVIMGETTGTETRQGLMGPHGKNPWRVGKSTGHRPKAPLISFTEEDEVGIHYLHCDALVVHAVVARNGLRKHNDMVGIDTTVVCRALKVDPESTSQDTKEKALEHQKVRRPEGGSGQAINQQDSSEKPSSPQWVSNPMLVRKSNKKWRVCIDFSDLNQACPKDSFPLPRIDLIG
ncbi:Uncharacterized protein Adt_27095 [Abeliophyllum distichum]|uniref:Uncharacterized protein n=1 Tax=Abeliophyllum distichum TaxID=126358 RepID=A0ABD1RUT1_9LAMI